MPQRLDDHTALRDLLVARGHQVEVQEHRLVVSVDGAYVGDLVHALLTGNPDEAKRAMSEAAAAGTEAGEPDTYAIERTLAAGIARQAADTATLERDRQPVRRSWR